MINYTERLTLLMQDVVSRVPALSFIDMGEVLVFARAGRSNAEGAFATCHCLTLPASEPGYYFWRDRSTQALTRRSEWFVTKSPTVSIGGHDVKYMLSFALPRFCDQSLDRSRKERFYPGAEPWIAKLDTVIHELYHIDPALAGIRRIEKGDGTYSANCHGHQFFEQVAEMVHAYQRAPWRRRRRQLPDVPVVSAALHRAARRAAAVRGGRAGREGGASARRAAAGALHPRRSAHPRIHARRIAPRDQEGRVPRRLIRASHFRELTNGSARVSASRDAR